MDLNKYTRPDAMKYSITGLTSKDVGGVSMPLTVDVPLSNVLYDSVNNVRIMQHIPAPSNRNGAANPQVECGGLTEVVGWGTYYTLGEMFDTAAEMDKKQTNVSFATATKGTVDPDNKWAYDTTRIVDFSKRKWCSINVSSESEDLAKVAAMEGYNKYLTVNGTEVRKGDEFKNEDVEIILVRPKMMAMMSSAILCTKPGSETGDLLMAYPKTSISTSQSTEVMKMQL